MIQAGVTRVAAFVPWQSVEADISHTLFRFLQGAAERKLEVSLILSPEVGIHHPGTGLPKDVLSDPENQAKDAQGRPITVALPPTWTVLPSMLAPDFNKRYFGYLGRIDGLLATLSKQDPKLLKHVKLILTGSFWKYFRSAQGSSGRAFSGPHGDYSAPATIQYRQKTDELYQQGEFQESTGGGIRWRSQAMEEVNRRWFYQNSEEVFRFRSQQTLRRRSPDLPLSHVELYSLEADPSNAVSVLLQHAGATGPDFTGLSKLLDEASFRISSVAGERAPVSFHWTSLGPFHGLSAPEKQFLILKSLLIAGACGGAIYLPVEEWLSLSRGFRNRTEQVARSLSEGALTLPKQVLYLGANLWSEPGMIWQQVRAKAGNAAGLVTSVDLVFSDRAANLVIVDPSVVMQRETVQKLGSIARSGRVVALPRSTLFTEAAKRELEKLVAKQKRIEMDFGMPYSLHRMGEGVLVVYECSSSITAEACEAFVASVLSLADVYPSCQMGDSRLSALPLLREQVDHGIFLFNGTDRAVTADVFFPYEVSVADLAITYLSDRTGPRAESELSSRFTFEVPAFGVIPLSVRGLIQDGKERREAALLEESTRESAGAAAETALPGLEGGDDLSAAFS